MNIFTAKRYPAVACLMGGAAFVVFLVEGLSWLAAPSLFLRMA